MKVKERRKEHKLQKDRKFEKTVTLSFQQKAILQRDKSAKIYVICVRNLIIKIYLLLIVINLQYFRSTQGFIENTKLINRT